MFLQSYIYQATSTLCYLSENTNIFEMVSEESRAEISEILITGLQDLRACTRTYRGLTCMAGCVADVSALRASTDVIASASMGIIANLRSDDSLEAALKVLQQWDIQRALKHMQRCLWNQWESARVAKIRGGYCGGFDSDLHRIKTSSSALKCLAKYMPAEGYAITQTFNQLKTENFNISGNELVLRWQSVCDVDVHAGKQGQLYIDLFRGVIPADNIESLFRYWKSLQSEATSYDNVMPAQELRPAMMAG